jgi:predicted alpha/beta-hydrolase family hydrolase
MARAIAERGIAVVTFDFLYAHTKRRVPDRNDVLEETWRAVISTVRGRAEAQGCRLFAGGKSMGGRIATQVAAQGGLGDVAGIVLLGYPLHPPGRPDRLRVAHLPRVSVPMLFVQGSRDLFGTPAELAPFVDSLPAGRLFVVEGGDHSLTPRKRGHDSLPLVMGRVAGEIAAHCS